MESNLVIRCVESLTLSILCSLSVALFSSSLLEFTKPYWKELAVFLDNERKQLGASEILPPEDLIFTAMNMTPFESIRVVILGQDPYHGTLGDDMAVALIYFVISLLF
jgi:uracil DNA glycosylase